MKAEEAAASKHSVFQLTITRLRSHRLTIDAEALSAEEMVPVEAKVDAKVGEAGGESSKAGEGETSKTAEGSGKGVA